LDTFFFVALKFLYYTFHVFSFVFHILLFLEHCFAFELPTAELYFLLHLQARGRCHFLHLDTSSLATGHARLRFAIVPPFSRLWDRGSRARSALLRTSLPHLLTRTLTCAATCHMHQVLLYLSFWTAMRLFISLRHFFSRFTLDIHWFTLTRCTTAFCVLFGCGHYLLPMQFLDTFLVWTLDVFTARLDIIFTGHILFISYVCSLHHHCWDFLFILSPVPVLHAVLLPRSLFHFPHFFLLHTLCLCRIFLGLHTRTVHFHFLFLVCHTFSLVRCHSFPPHGYHASGSCTRSWTLPFATTFAFFTLHCLWLRSTAALDCALRFFRFSFIVLRSHFIARAMLVIVTVHLHRTFLFVHAPGRLTHPRCAVSFCMPARSLDSSHTRTHTIFLLRCRYLLVIFLAGLRLQFSLLTCRSLLVSRFTVHGSTPLPP